MAFDLQHFQFNRGVTTANAQGSGFTPVIHGYKSGDDSRATISGASYFPDNIDGTTDKVFVGDLLLIVGSDGTSLCPFNSLVPVVLGTDLLVSGPSLTVGAPIAPVDTNAIRISGNVIQAERATAVAPGIITTTTQTFAGTKAFNDGINVFGPGILADSLDSTGANPITIGAGATNVHIVPTITADNLITATSGLTIGGGQALAFFEYTNSLVSWTGPFTVAQGGSFYAQRINGEVYLNVSGIALAAATNPNQSINSGVILPVGFRPLTQVNGLLFITSNSTTAVGEYFINTNGTIIIFAGLNGNFFAGAGNANFGDFSSHYSGA